MNELELIAIIVSVVVATISVGAMLVTWLDYRASVRSALREADRGIAFFEALSNAQKDGDEARITTLLAHYKR